MSAPFHAARLSAADQKLEDERLLRLAHQAKELLENPLLLQAFAVVEAQWTRALRSFDPDKQPEVGIAARRKLEALDCVRRELQAVVQTGKMVEQRRSQGSEVV